MELGLELGQKQIFTPQMQLSARILQMNTLELDQYLKEAALENPVIELDYQPEADNLEIERLQKLEWLDSVDESNSFSYISQGEIDECNTDYCRCEEESSLRDVLLQQLPGFRLTGEMETLVRYLINNLDENGYLTMQCDNLIKESSASQNLFDDALGILQRMEPPGVGARDLKECLLIQSRRLAHTSCLLDEIIQNHLDLLAKNQLAKLTKILSVSLDEVKEARRLLLSLNPKPGNGYSAYNAIPYIRADLFVVRFESGYQVILNDYREPKLEISNYYRELAKIADGEAADYLRDNFGRAEWLSKCVRQRKKTILRCTRVILDKQKGFFDNGPGNLMPLHLSDVAQVLKLHLSTVSRAVSGKYLQCQWGIFRLEDFFTRNIGEASNDRSQDAVKNMIAGIIGGEDAQKPYSDKDITGLLEQQGIAISRRTVAKYRDRLGIPVAARRKIF